MKSVHKNHSIIDIKEPPCHWCRWGGGGCSRAPSSSSCWTSGRGPPSQAGPRGAGWSPRSEAGRWFLHCNIAFLASQDGQEVMFISPAVHTVKEGKYLEELKESNFPAISLHLMICDFTKIGRWTHLDTVTSISRGASKDRWKSCVISNNFPCGGFPLRKMDHFSFFTTDLRMNGKISKFQNHLCSNSFWESWAQYLNMLPGLANGTLNSSIHSRRVTSSALFSFDPCLEES